MRKTIHALATIQFFMLPCHWLFGLSWAATLWPLLLVLGLGFWFWVVAASLASAARGLFGGR